MVSMVASSLRPSRSSRVIARWVGMILGALAASLLSGCSTAPRSYASPESAVDSLVGALRSGNQDQLHRILGSDADKLISSGDPVADSNGQAEFLRLYDEKHNLSATDEDTRTLEVGNTAWPVPIPVVKGDEGWYFDTAAGLDEMLSRRIGRNELYAIQVCLAIIDAEKEYAAADYNGDGWREYARTFNSDPGKKNGLYWPTAPGEPQSPLGELVAAASAEGYTGDANRTSDTSRPFHGYYFRILTRQGPAAEGGAIDLVAHGHMIGGFGVIAWPVEYANSGLKTFIASHHGVVYEKDLGDDTDRLARAVTAFNPESGWEPSDTSEEP
jgi:Protein of unknown function (DUF2950)